MRPVEPFDPAHIRCIFPFFGKQFDTAMANSGLSIMETAKAVGIAPEAVRGYRRGFARPSTATKAKLDVLFSTSFNITETKASEAADLTDLGVASLVAALNAHGFAVELRPL